jgi:hypothetical protein
MEMSRNPAFIIGNGESRRNFDLNHIKGVAPIFGCNALYRDFSPDWLVAVDLGMVDEISSSDFPVEYTLFPRSKAEEYEPAEMHPGRNRYPRNNSGMYSMQRAIEKKHNILICLGFDFLINDSYLSCTNLFAGTKNYGAETHANFEDNAGRIRYLEWLASKNEDVIFIFVLEDLFPKVPVGAKNIFTIPYRILKSNIANYT